MIDFYTFPGPNGRKVQIMLEELAVPYTVRTVDITRGEQFAPEFLRISPNNKIPAIVDNDNGLALMESGAILLYLAKKTGKFIPQDEEGYFRCVEWLMWQMGGAGPMLGQAHHFLHFNPGKAAYAEERFGNEAKRIYGVLDKRLAETGAYMAGKEYTIADMATWPWVSRFEWQQIDLNEFPNVKRWYIDIANRPATKRGYDQPKYVSDIPMPA